MPLVPGSISGTKMNSDTKIIYSTPGMATSTYKNNPYLKDSQEYNSNSQNRPLIKPSNAMKSIVMSETFNIK